MSKIIKFNSRGCRNTQMRNEYMTEIGLKVVRVSERNVSDKFEGAVRKVEEYL